MPVYDQTYQHWEGQVRARAARFWPIAFEGVRGALKTKPSPFLNVLSRAMFILSQLPFLFYLVVIFVTRLYTGFHIASRTFDPASPRFYLDVLRNETVWVLMFTVFIGSGLIARDQRVNAIEGYLAKPLTVLDYVLGKFLVIAFFLSCVTLFPCLLLWLADWLLSSEAGYVQRILPQLGRIVVLSLLVIATCGLTVLAVSSLTKSDKVAALMWIGGNTVLFLVGKMMSKMLQRPDLALISPFEAALAIGRRWFDLESVDGEDSTLTAGWVLGAYLLVSTIILFARVRAIAMRRD
jgi:hypothetical protein